MALTLRAQLAARHLDLDLHVADAERVAVLGPNGSGKSSTLDVVAGTLRPDRGHAELNGRVLFDLSDGRGRWRAPHTRAVSLLAQDALLFPHLSVLDNVAFAPRAAGASTRAARANGRHWLEEVDAAGLADRRPGQLSGGQAQRVAIARALAGEPQLLLLDEPMAALDVATAPLLRRTLRRVLTGRSTLIVTHDLLDALLLSDRVVVLDHGRIIEEGATEDVIRHPRTDFTARIAGLNLIRGTAEGGKVRRSDGCLVEGVCRAEPGSGEAAVAVFSPSAVSVFADPPSGSPRNTFDVHVTELEPRQDHVRVRAALRPGPPGASLPLTADVTAAAVAELDLYPGRAVQFSVKATAVTIYPA